MDIFYVTRCIANSDLISLERAIHSGVDPNSYDEWGNTLLMIAVGNKQYECISKLVALGAKAHTSGLNGYTPLEVARSLRDNKSLEILHAAIAKEMATSFPPPAP